MEDLADNNQLQKSLTESSSGSQADRLEDEEALLKNWGLDPDDYPEEPGETLPEIPEEILPYFQERTRSAVESYAGAVPPQADLSAYSPRADAVRRAVKEKIEAAVVQQASSVMTSIEAGFFKAQKSLCSDTLYALQDSSGRQHGPEAAKRPEYSWKPGEMIPYASPSKASAGSDGTSRVTWMLPAQPGNGTEQEPRFENSPGSAAESSTTQDAESGYEADAEGSLEAEADAEGSLEAEAENSPSSGDKKSSDSAGLISDSSMREVSSPIPGDYYMELSPAAPYAFPAWDAARFLETQRHARTSAESAEAAASTDPEDASTDPEDASMDLEDASMDLEDKSAALLPHPFLPLSDRKTGHGQKQRRTVFIGDSRTVGMEIYLGGREDEIWQAKNSMGYNWFVSSGVPGVEDLIGPDTDVVILMGVNDLGNAGRYVEYMNTKAAEWKERGARTFFVSVTPVIDSKSPNAKNSRIEAFNAYAVENLKGVTYIDAYSRIRSTFGSPDGIHFDAATYGEIYRIIHFYLYSGWYEEAGLRFYFDRGRPLTGWQYLDGEWQYMDGYGVRWIFRGRVGDVCLEPYPYGDFPYGQLLDPNNAVF